MSLIQRLELSDTPDTNATRVAAHLRGEAMVLDKDETVLLDVLRRADAFYPLGQFVLGRGIAEGSAVIGGHPFTIGYVEVDHENPDGVWFQYDPL